MLFYDFADAEPTIGAKTGTTSALEDRVECCNKLQAMLKNVYITMAYLGLGLLIFVLIMSILLCCCLRYVYSHWLTLCFISIMTACPAHRKKRQKNFIEKDISFPFSGFELF